MRNNRLFLTHAEKAEEVALVQARGMRLGQDVVRQDGLVGLFRAAQTFDPARGVSFATWMSRCIGFQLHLSAKEIRPLRNRVEDLPVGVNDDPVGLLEHLRHLPPLLKAILWLSVVEQKSYGEIGRRVGLGERQIGRYCRLALHIARHEARQAETETQWRGDT